MTQSPEDAAATLLDGCDTIPVPVERILRAQNVGVGRNWDRSHVSSFMYREGTRRIVGVNTAISPRRQRFALTHALGHVVLHHKPLIVCHSIRLDLHDSPCTPTLAMEGVCDRFAGALLMPREPLADALRSELAGGHASRDALIGALARRFGVSVEAMGWRLVSLNLTMA